MEQVVITINQSFFLFCCAEQYNIKFSNQSLSSTSNYFLRYTYPDGTTADASAQLSSTNVLTSQSPEHHHSCTVHVRLYTSGEQAKTIAEFSIDLVSPIEYLFRKFSANELEVSDKISGKMTSALLAMALSYYYVMGEHIEKEIRRTDEILTTLLNWSSDDTYSNLTVDERKKTSTDEGIALFAHHYKLQKTVRYLAEDNSVGDLPVHLPKSFLPPVKTIPPKRPAIIPRAKSKTLPARSTMVPVVPTRQVSKSSSGYSPLQPAEMDPQESYMYMEKEDKCGANNDIPDDGGDGEEEYFLVDSPDNDSKTNHREPLRTTMSPSASMYSPEDSTDELYEICDLTPVEKAAAVAAAAKKKRGPPPKPPAAYRHSHTIDPTKGYPGSSGLESTQMSLSARTDPRISDPLAKKKYNVFHKPKTKS